VAKKALLFLFIALPLVLGCDSQLPLSSTGLSETGDPGSDYEQMSSWIPQLAEYKNQIAEALEEIEDIEDYSGIYGRGKKTISGTGTFYGEGVGIAKLEGVGIISGSIEGSILVRGTEYIIIDGLEFITEENGYKRYHGTGHFTATSDLAQYIEVVVQGDGWVLGAGTGMVTWSAVGWAFWYH